MRNLNIKVDIIKNNQKEVLYWQITLSEIKYSWNKHNNRPEITEEKVVSLKTNQKKSFNLKNKRKKNCQLLEPRWSLERYQWSNVCKESIRTKRERKQSRKNTFEGKMDEMFLNWDFRKPIYRSKKLGETHAR